MDTRTKTGGRQKGTPNKRTKELIAAIEEVCPNYDPVVAMAKIANDANQDPNLRIQCHKEVAQYVHAKRKAVEIDALIEGEVGVRSVTIAGTDPQNP